MNLIALPPRRYALPLSRTVQGARDHHQLITGVLIGYRLGPHQGWMTAADLPGRPQWREAILRFAHAAARQSAEAAAARLSWPESLALRWGTPLRLQVPLQLTADFADLSAGRAAQWLRETGCQALKLKVMAAHDERALEGQIPRLLMEFPTLELRLDANQSWGSLGPAALRQRLQLCADLGVTLCEDPATPEDWPHDSPLPLAADLIDSDAAALIRLARAGALKLAVIKPSLCGDPDQFRDLAEELASLQVAVSVSSLFDAPVGLAMLAGLAAAMPGTLAQSGLATHLGLDEPWSLKELRPDRGSWPLHKLWGTPNPRPSAQPESPAPQPESPAPLMADVERALPGDPWAQAAAETPHLPALTWTQTGESWSFAEFDHQVTCAGAWLHALGVNANTSVLLWADNSPALAVVLVACARIGAVAAPLHPRLQPQEVELLQYRISPGLCLHDSAHSPPTPGWQRLGGWPLESSAHCPRQCGELAALVATSGTSGQPKIARIGQTALFAAAHGHWASAPPVGPQRWLACLPLCHVSGLLVLWRCAVARAHVLLTADARAESLAAAVDRHQPTIVSLVPTLLARLLDLGAHPGALQTVLVGGASCDPQLLIRARQAGWPVRATYGMTETCAQLATATAAEPLQEQHGLRRVGPLLPGMAARVIGDGPEGEIAVSGPQLFSGYLGLADAGLELVNGEIWFRTGDHGQLDGDGALWVASRRLDRLMRGGENIDPIEVESALLQVPGVVEAAVAGVADALWGEQVGAWLVVRDADSFAIESCSAAMARLAPFKRPTRWRISTAPLPRNSLGKLLRTAVRDGLQGEGG